MLTYNMYNKRVINQHVLELILMTAAMEVLFHYALETMEEPLLLAQPGYKNVRYYVNS